MADGTDKAAIPRDWMPDGSLALLLLGYNFIKHRCARLGSDAFTTRIMLHKATCLMGEEAAAMFYTGDKFTRVGGMPNITFRLLQDYESVQTLDGPAMQHRKAMFLALNDEAAIARLAAIARKEWLARIPDWERRGRIVLFDEAREVLTCAISAWAGVPLEEDEVKPRTRELSAMIEGSGTVGPRAWWGLLLRARHERWVKDKLRRIRSGEIRCPDGAPAKMIAEHREPDGSPIPLGAAAVELINVLRASMAVARYIVFGAIMLHEKPALAAKLRSGGAAYAEAFAQEVRRLCPFFPFIGGRVREDFEWRGKRFKQGEWVLLDLYGTNVDPRSHREPERFDPERFVKNEVCPFAFVPQGGGDAATGHRCPGETITLTLTEVGLDVLVRDLLYDVPPQDLSVNLRRIPALPKSGFVMTNIRRARPSRSKGEASQESLATTP